jgi:hypothetical protein
MIQRRDMPYWREYAGTLDLKVRSELFSFFLASEEASDASCHIASCHGLNIEISPSLVA